MHRMLHMLQDGRELDGTYFQHAPGLGSPLLPERSQWNRGASGHVLNDLDCSPWVAAVGEPMAYTTEFKMRRLADLDNIPTVLGEPRELAFFALKNAMIDTEFHTQLDPFINTLKPGRYNIPDFDETTKTILKTMHLLPERQLSAILKTNESRRFVASLASKVNKTLSGKILQVADDWMRVAN